jgi:Domain of unknown function (DUF4266)
MPRPLFLRIAKRYLVFIFSIIAIIHSTGCQHIGAKVWERGTLAKSEMQEESLKVDHSFDEHIYFSKEAASGGRGFGGGGCGCN